ncbi:hypothetical protein TSUD_290190 [Trifolium subterraneum]|uniref:Exportin-2 C-terminal domain-containing protein n=1 Tax=Trifolium subterraneum TaxID=3900 RepID=A0A2Z6NBH8_TRISU|nr:hypothetical protein TSUD_290190 [Trifolium subterraneum]
MKCIMTVLGVADIQRHDALVCIEGLGSLLYVVCKNPKNPFFNQYLYEAVAILLLALLVELNRPPIPPTYMQIFVIILSPVSWKTASNVPALVRLLQAFLKKAPNEISQGDRLTKILGIFDALIQSSSTSEQGFYVLNTVIEIDTINAVQPDLFSVILTQFWIRNLKLITGDIELKLTAVASTRLICESPVLLDSVSWGTMVDSIVTLLSRQEQDKVQDENAGKNKEEPLKEIRYPREFFICFIVPTLCTFPWKVSKDYW